MNCFLIRMFLKNDQATSSMSRTKIGNLLCKVPSDNELISKLNVLMSLPDNYGLDSWPSKHEYVVYLQATSIQQELLEKNNLKLPIVVEYIFNSQTGSCTDYAKARSLLGHPVLKEKTLIPSIDQSQKFQLIWYLVEQCKKHQEKIIIASSSTEVIEFYKNLMLQKNMIRSYNFSMIHGSVSDYGRMNGVKSFWNNGFSIIFMTIQTGGMGLNLQCGQRIVLLDLVYDNVEMKQLIGRCHRKGQAKEVYFYQFVTVNTLGASF
jgi:SNF2 family DNA or RNA helicase